MLNVFKKVEEPRQDVGDVKSSGFEPPKNLPDLARDIYEHESSIDTTSLNHSSASSPPISTKVSEPSKISVPKLDLSLVREQMASSTYSQNNLSSGSQATLQTINPQINSSNVSSTVSPNIPLMAQQQFVPSSISSPQISVSSQSPESQNILSNLSNQFLQQLLQQTLQQNMLLSQLNQQKFNPQQYNSTFSQVSQPLFSNELAKINTSTNDINSSFFKELENYVKDNGFNNELIDDLLDKNLLDNMIFYHTVKSEDISSYNSTAEFSHAIKLRLEELQNLERNWTSTKNKSDLLKNLSSAMESDVRLKSEELKRIIRESKKIGNNRSNDFFQLIHPKSSVDTLKPDFIQSESSGVSNISSISPATSADSESLIIRPKIQLSNYNIYDPSKYFYAQNGQVFKSLADLVYGLEKMDDGTFNFHVNSVRNDFSLWVKGVFNDILLSDSIKFLMTRDKLISYFKRVIN